MNALYVALGGALGSLARYGITRMTFLLPQSWTGTSNWLGTLTVNVLGSFLIGCLTMGLKDARPDLAYLSPLLVTGFCGGFTTFSTFALDGSKLWTNGASALSLAYIILSLTLSFAALFLGFRAAGWMTR